MGIMYKASLVFRFDPSSLSVAAVAPKIGGWTESVWVPALPTDLYFDQWANLRMSLACTDVSVVGNRYTPYVYTGNKLTPGKGFSGPMDTGGILGGGTNSPDDSMVVTKLNSTVPIAFRDWLHAVPDSLIDSGTLSVSTAYRAALTGLFTFFSGGRGAIFPTYWLGRDATQVAGRVLSYSFVPGPPVVGTLITSVPIGAVAGSSWVRFRRCYDINGNPVKGSYFVTAAVLNANGTWTYTLQASPQQTVSTPSGTVRVDLIAVAPVQSCQLTQYSERKIGRPSFLYRGRRSKQRI